MLRCCNVVVAMGLLLFSMVEVVMASSLTKAMEMAVERDPRIKTIEAELQEADELISEAKGVYYPTIRGQGELGWVDNKDATVREGSKKLVGLELTQNLWSSGRNQAGVSYALSHVQATHARLRSEVNRVSLEVAEAWLDVVRVKRVSALYREYRENIAFQLSAATEKSKLGVGRVTDVSLVDARMRQVEADLRKVEAEQLVALQSLQRLVGKLPDVAMEIWPPQKEWPVPDDIAVHVDLFHLPHYMEYRFELEKAGFDLDRRRAERRFSLDLQGNIARGTFGDAKADNQGVMVTLNVPIYEGGILRSRERSAAKRVEQVRQQLHEQEEKILLEIENGLAIWQSNVEVVELMGAAVRAEQSAVEGVTEEVDAGVRPLLDLLKADEELLQRRIGFIKANHQQWLSRFKLLQLIVTGELYLLGKG